MCMRHRGGMQTGSNQSGEVSHVHHQVGTDFISDPAELGEIQASRVRRPARQNQFGTPLMRKPSHLVHIHPMIVGAHVVTHSVV
ncbi:Uncharacterised protein [Mycobacteroides abscessus subsp. massiliense]|nr:Uncharacterised protein [Mycobacteroides abscessus subsp. massiliense]